MMYKDKALDPNKIHIEIWRITRNLEKLRLTNIFNISLKTKRCQILGEEEFCNIFYDEK